MIVLRKAEFMNGMWSQDYATVAVNEQDISSVEHLLDLPQNMMGGMWDLSKITMRNGTVIHACCSPSDFVKGKDQA